jgi:Tol biopolymer transport system component
MATLGPSLALDGSPSEPGDSGSSGSDAPPATCSLPADAAARWIAFDSDRVAYNRDIYLARADGSDLVRLTTEASTEKDPAFSHDAKSLAFASDRTGSMQIHVMDLSTRQVTQLTSVLPGVDGGTVSGGADQPSWSQDDRQIVFHDGASVYIMAADGTGARILATGLDAFNAYKYPSLSRDGTEVLVDRNNEIDAIKVDGTGTRYVVQNWTTTEETPALSPDGVNVAFAVGCSPGEQLAVTPFAGYAADPCKTAQITPASAGTRARRPAWGPAGVVAFERSSGGQAPFAIAISTAPGSQPCDLIGGAADNRDPSWAPAGFTAK